MALPYLNISPVAFYVGSFAVRWYALAYIAGFLLGTYLLQKLLNSPTVARPKPFLTAPQAEDLLSYVGLSVIMGGRLGYVLFYRPDYYAQDWHRIYRLWEGGMSFHGGVVGVAIGMSIFAWRHKLSVRSVADAVCVVVPLGLFFGRLANFMNSELYGRVTTVPWAVHFPLPHGGYSELVHPTQLYEAASEGLLLLLLLLYMVCVKAAWQRRGLVAGVFLAGYAVARSVCELWREPDSFLGFVVPWGAGGITQGMLLSAPMLLLGMALILRSKYER